VGTEKRSLNLEIIVSNLTEAAEEFEKLRARASNGELNEANLQVELLHAYHHLNFAWNIRHVSTSQYTKLTQEQFNRWGKYPSEIENL
jgi:hypothetical protein